MKKIIALFALAFTLTLTSTRGADVKPQEPSTLLFVISERVAKTDVVVESKHNWAYFLKSARALLETNINRDETLELERAVYNIYAAIGRGVHRENAAAFFKGHDIEDVRESLTFLRAAIKVKTSLSKK
jgi:hypothetical protein